MLLIELYKVVLTCEPVDEVINVVNQIKLLTRNFLQYCFLCQLEKTFETVDKILKKSYRD